MQKTSLLFFYFIVCFFTSCHIENKKVDKSERSYNNPLPVEFGDPFILNASDGKYYMIGTGGVKDGFKMYSSDDLKVERRRQNLSGKHFRLLECSQLLGAGTV